MQVTLSVNDIEYTRDVEPRLLLVHFLRDELGLTGTHWGCDTSNCGTCVVLMDDEPVKSCTVLAATASRYEVRTVEGLEVDGVLDPVQEGFTRGARAAVRVLHAGDDADRPGAAGPQPEPHRRRDPGGDLRPDLPLHGLRDDRPLDPLGGRAFKPGDEQLMMLDRTRRCDDAGDRVLRPAGTSGSCSGVVVVAGRRGDRDHDRAAGAPDRQAGPDRGAGRREGPRADRPSSPGSAGSTTPACGSCTPRGRCERWRSGK